MISVIVCTYNRASLLDKLLESLAGQDFDGDYEVMVVDNNSTDNTAEIVAKWSKRFTVPVVYVLETRQGLSYARNTGTERARGDIIAYIDDDAIADSRWLANMAQVFDSRPDIMGIGGPANPIWAQEPPQWISQELLDLFGVGEYGPKPFIMKGKIYPVGVNCAIRSSIFETVALFSPELGHIGESLLSGEEVDFFHRVRSSGAKLLYAPTVTVDHHIPLDRMTEEYVRQRKYWQGRSIAVWDRLQEGLSLEVRNAALRLMAVVVRDIPLYLWIRLTKKASLTLTYSCRLIKARGYVEQSWIDLRTAAKTGRRVRSVSTLPSEP